MKTLSRIKALSFFTFLSMALVIAHAGTVSYKDPITIPISVEPSSIKPLQSASFDMPKVQRMVLYNIRCNLITTQNQDPFYLSASVRSYIVNISSVSLDGSEPSPNRTFTISTAGHHSLSFNYCQTRNFDIKSDNPDIGLFNASTDTVSVDKSCVATPVVGTDCHT